MNYEAADKLIRTTQRIQQCRATLVDRKDAETLETLDQGILAACNTLELLIPDIEPDEHQKKEATTSSTNEPQTAHGCKIRRVKSQYHFHRIGNILVKQQFGPFAKVYETPQYRGACDAHTEDNSTWFRHIYRPTIAVWTHTGHSRHGIRYIHPPNEYKWFIKDLNHKLQTLHNIHPVQRYYVLTNLELEPEHTQQLHKPTQFDLVLWDANKIGELLTRTSHLLADAFHE